MKPHLISIGFILLVMGVCMSLVWMDVVCRKKYERIYDYRYPTPYGIEIAACN